MKKILIIDDDRDMAELVKALLKYYGFEATISLDPEAGVRIAQQKQPDLILMDVIMPTMNGREACRLLKKNPLTQHIPVLFLTAKDSIDDRLGESAVGGAGHLSKPFDSKELLENIRKILFPT